MPKFANRAPFALVVDSLLVWAAYYGVCHRNRQHSMLLYKLQYLSSDIGIGTNITTIQFPIAQLLHLRILGWHDTNCYFCRLAQVRAIKSNGRNRPTPQSLARLLVQAFEESIFHGIAPSATVVFTIWPARPCPLILQLPMALHCANRRFVPLTTKVRCNNFQPIRSPRRRGRAASAVWSGRAFWRS